MNSRVLGALISFWLQLLFYWVRGDQEKSLITNGFLGHRAVLTYQGNCACKTSYSCSCCQNVRLLHTKAEKELCVNFTYQRNGLNIDVTLNYNILSSRTVTDYKPLKFCNKIPGCYFSSACVHVLELNKFPRSITACLRLDIFSKKRLWQLNYDCVSISTELPTIQTNGTTTLTNAITRMSTMTAGMTSAMTSSQMTMTTVSSTADTEETTSSDVEVITIPGSGTTIMDID